MAKNWAPDGVLSMAAIWNISAADSLLAQRRQLQGRDDSSCAQQDPASRHPDMSLCCFTKSRINKSFLALNGSPGDRQGQTNAKTSRSAAAYINSGT